MEIDIYGEKLTSFHETSLAVSILRKQLQRRQNLLSSRVSFGILNSDRTQIMVANKMLRTKWGGKMVCGQYGIGQNDMEQMVRTE